MNRLQDKLAELNRIHLKKKSLAGKASTGKKSLRFPVPIPKGNSEDLISSVTTPEGWPEITDDTATFSRKKKTGHKLEQIIPCLDVSYKKEKRFFRIKRNMPRFWKRYKNFIKLFFSETGDSRLEQIEGFPADPEKVCFLDLETCGFSGCPLFLIGICYFKDRNLVLDQLFARDYDEELSVITAFWSIFESFNTLVTFNGKSFDWPFLEERSYVCGQKPLQPEVHLDLLHAARRKWKYRLPNCKLQTLEHFFCRRSRVGDLPGSQIPQAYHDFVNNPGDPSAMAAAIHHNALDVITMAELLLVMLTDEKCVGAY
jgi:uncharacterized protein YprB with RNaseH-like and TPR domain